MSFRNKPWERSARKVIRAALRASHARWKEYRKRRSRLPVLSLWGMVFLMPFSVLLLQLGETDGGFQRLYVAACLYASGTVFLRMGALGNRLYNSPERTWALHVPITDRDFFGFASLQSFKGSLFVPLLLLLVYVSHPEPGAGGYQRWVAVGTGAALQWAVVVVLALAGLQFWEKQSVGPGLLFHIAMLAAAFSPMAAQGLAPALILLPAGWIHRLVESQMANPWILAASLTLLSMLLSAIAILWRGLREKYPEREISVHFPEHEDDEEELGPAPDDPNAQPLPDLLGTRTWFLGAQKRNQILCGDLAAPLWESAGWIERLAVRWMSAREQNILQFASAEEPDAWTVPWFSAWKWLGIGFLLVLARFILPDWLQWLPFVPPVIAFLHVAPIFGGAWALFRPHPAGLQQTSLHAHYPLGYFEISRVILKLNLARFLAAVPVATLAGSLGAIGSGDAVLDGALLGLKVIVIAVALQPFFVAAKFSPGTNDTKRFTMGTLLLVAVGFVALGVLVATLVAFLVLMSAGRADWAGFALAAMAAVSYGFWGFYGRRFEHGRIDTVTSPPRVS